MNDRPSRIAWITGGGTGIGRELALRLAARGWTVAISGRRRERLDEVVAAGTDGRIHAFALDVTDAAANRECARAIEARFGAIDLAFLNAGMYRPFKVSEFSSAPFDEITAVNYLGVVYGIDAVLPGMRERGRGHVAIVASVAGYSGLPLAAPYAATKAALINLAESLKFDFDRMGLKLSVVNPGFVETPLTAQNRFHMPFLIGVEAAAAHIERGLDAGHFEIAFPRPFVLLLKFFRILPYWLYFPLMRRFIGRR